MTTALTAEISFRSNAWSDASLPTPLRCLHSVTADFSWNRLLFENCFVIAYLVLALMTPPVQIVKRMSYKVSYRPISFSVHTAGNQLTLCMVSCAPSYVYHTCKHSEPDAPLGKMI
jgi:hypothetical protein